MRLMLTTRVQKGVPAELHSSRPWMSVSCWKHDRPKRCLFVAVMGTKHGIKQYSTDLILFAT